jgi:type II secretory pathway component GspD/PulD (secretin)
LIVVNRAPAAPLKQEVPGQSTSTSVFTLQYAKANAAAIMLKQLFKSDDVKVVPDDRTNIVVVRASKAQLDEMASVVKNLDQPNAVEEKDQKPKVTRLLRIKYAVATDIAQVLQGSIAGKRAASISVDSRTNSIVVVADELKTQEIANLVANLDIPVEEDGYSTINVVKLSYAKADQMVRLISSSTDSKGVKSITADPRTNSIVIRASPMALREIMNVVRSMDVQAP